MCGHCYHSYAPLFLPALCSTVVTRFTAPMADSDFLCGFWQSLHFSYLFHRTSLRWTAEDLPLSRTRHFVVASVYDPGGPFPQEFVQMTRGKVLPAPSYKGSASTLLISRLNPFNLSASGSYDSLSTLNSFRYLHASKTRYSVGGLTLHRRDFHPIDKCAGRRT